MITEKHKQFAREIVALARKHGMNDLSVTFNASSSENFLHGGYSHNRVALSWKEGRHGDHMPIKINLSSEVFVKEEIEQ